LLTDDEQRPKAERLVQQWLSRQHAPADSHWTCPECGERHEPQFEACWKCDAVFDPT